MSRTYEQLVQLVRDWANRDSEALPDQIIQDCLRWAADKAYRTLRVPPLEQTVTYSMDQLIAATSSSNNRFSSVTELAIPEDLIEFIQIRGIDAEGRTTRMFNEKADVRTFNDLYSEKYNDLAFWTRQNNCILLAPGFGNTGNFYGSSGVTPEAGVELYYYRRLPGLDARYMVSSDVASQISEFITSNMNGTDDPIVALNGALDVAQSAFIDMILDADPMDPEYTELLLIKSVLEETLDFPAIPEQTVNVPIEWTNENNVVSLDLPITIQDPRMIPMGSPQTTEAQTFTSTTLTDEHTDLPANGFVPFTRLEPGTAGRNALLINIEVGSAYDSATGQISGDLRVNAPIFIGFYVDFPGQITRENWADFGFTEGQFPGTINPTNAPVGDINLISQTGHRFTINAEVPFVGLPYRFTGPHNAGIISNNRFVLASTESTGSTTHTPNIRNTFDLDAINTFIADMMAIFPSNTTNALIRHDAQVIYDFDDIDDPAASVTLPILTELRAGVSETRYSITVSGTNAAAGAALVQTALQGLPPSTVTFPTIPEVMETRITDTLYTWYPATDPNPIIVGRETDRWQRWLRGRYVPNWLRDQNERVLLMGALSESYFYLQEDDQAAKYAQLFQAEIAELNDEDVRRNASGGNVQVNFNGRGMI